MLPISLIRMFPIISRANPTLWGFAGSFLAGVVLSWYILSGIGASKELAERNAELLLIKSRLKAVVEVSMKYREDTLLLEKEYAKFKEQNEQDPSSSPDCFPARRVHRLNQIR